jgi:hypothetical protein
MSAWLASLRDRPIAEHERRATLTVVAGLLIAAALLLTLTRPVSRHFVLRSDPPASAARSTPDPPAPARGPASSTALSPALARVSREFLSGYLAYIYGHAPARRTKDATSGLVRSLQAHPPLVSPVMRARHPRVLELRSAPGTQGQLAVTALISDGGVADYPVGLLLARQGRRLLVTGLEER